MRIKSAAENGKLLREVDTRSKKNQVENEQMIREMAAKFSGQVDLLSKQLLEATTQLGDQRNKIVRLEQKIADLEEELKNKTNELADTKAENVTLKAQVATLETEVEDARQQVIRLTQRVVELEQLQHDQAKAAGTQTIASMINALPQKFTVTLDEDNTPVSPV